MRFVQRTTPNIAPANGTGSMRAVLGTGPQGLPGPGAAAWPADTAVTTGAVYQAPDGSWIKSTGNRTTGSTFDATEAAFWTAVLGTAGTVEADALTAAYARILSPSGDTTGATDTAAIQALWDAGKSVSLVQDETYWASGLILPSGCQLWVNGALCKVPNGANEDFVTSEDFQTWTGSTADGDVGSGIARSGIHGPGIIDGNKANQTLTSTTIAAGSDGVSLPQATINVADTTGFPTSGSVSFLTATGLQVVKYTGTTGTTLTGCTLGTGAMSTGTPVYHSGFGVRAFWRSSVLGGGGMLEVRNCYADGVWTEWGAAGTVAVKADGGMESEKSGIKTYGNGRYGFVARGPHDSWWNRILAFANGVGGIVTSGQGQAYINQVHTWGTPQAIGVDCYTETHLNQCAMEVVNSAGSIPLRINGVQVTARGRIFAPPGGAPIGGNIGVVMRGSATNCDLDLQVLDCANGALVTESDGGGNRIRILASQLDGPAVVRLRTTITSGSNGVNVSSFAGAGTLNVVDTTNFPTSGGVMVGTASGPRLVTYTGKTGTTLTGCTGVGSGVMATDGMVTVCNVRDGEAVNDTANVHATTALTVAAGGGTSAPSVDTKQASKKESGSIAPSATISTYGTPKVFTISDNAVGMRVFEIGCFSTAGIAGDALTFQIIVTYDNGTTVTYAPSFADFGVNANGASDKLKGLGNYSTWSNGRHITKVSVAVRSTIGSSAATVTAYLLAYPY